MRVPASERIGAGRAAGAAAGSLRRGALDAALAALGALAVRASAPTFGVAVETTVLVGTAVGGAAAMMNGAGVFVGAVGIHGSEACGMNGSIAFGYCWAATGSR